MKVRERCRKGIPASLRSRAWTRLCGAYYFLDNPSHKTEFKRLYVSSLVSHIQVACSIFSSQTEPARQPKVDRRHREGPAPELSDARAVRRRVRAHRAVRAVPRAQGLLRPQPGRRLLPGYGAHRRPPPHEHAGGAGVLGRHQLSPARKKINY